MAMMMEHIDLAMFKASCQQRCCRLQPDAPLTLMVHSCSLAEFYFKAEFLKSMQPLAAAE
jgi:hypothetical protein